MPPSSLGVFLLKKLVEVLSKTIIVIEKQFSEPLSESIVREMENLQEKFKFVGDIKDQFLDFKINGKFFYELIDALYLDNNNHEITFYGDKENNQIIISKLDGEHTCLYYFTLGDLIDLHMRSSFSYGYFPIKEFHRILFKEKKFDKDAKVFSVVASFSLTNSFFLISDGKNNESFKGVLNRDYIIEDPIIYTKRMVEYEKIASFQISYVLFIELLDVLTKFNNFLIISYNKDYVTFTATSYGLVELDAKISDIVNYTRIDDKYKDYDFYFNCINILKFLKKFKGFIENLTITDRRMVSLTAKFDERTDLLIIITPKLGE